MMPANMKPMLHITSTVKPAANLASDVETIPFGTWGRLQRGTARDESNN